MTDLGLLPLRLVYLLVVLIDFLKIDRSFIVGLGEDLGDEAIVSGRCAWRTLWGNSVCGGRGNPHALLPSPPYY